MKRLQCLSCGAWLDNNYEDEFCQLCPPCCEAKQTWPLAAPLDDYREAEEWE